MARWDHLRLMALIGCSTCINASGFTRSFFERGFERKAFWKAVYIKHFEWRKPFF